MPFRGAAVLGRGVNTLTGEILGKALNVKKTERAVTGGEASYDVQIVESHESLMESLGLSIAASGRYGLFSAEGKFELSEKSSFNAQSTFVVASCRVKNAFEQIDQVEVLEEAKPLLEDKNRFKTAFGTAFVRGLQTGGEFFAVFQCTSTSQETQSSLSASFHASCQGLVASADFKAKLDVASKSAAHRTEIKVLTYQKAGADEQLSYVNDAAGIIQRLKDFPKIARENPAGYEAEWADYNTLPLPQVNEEEMADREMSLADCARLRLKFMTRRNDIEFARENRAFFEELPSDEQLMTMWEQYSRAVTEVQRHAQRIAGRKIEPTVFDPTALQPPLELTLVAFKRTNVPNDRRVPRLIGFTVEAAKEELRRIGLEPDMDLTAVEKDQGGVALNTILTQSPVDGEQVQPGSRVRLTANYVPEDRFPWQDKFVKVRHKPFIPGGD
jgi:hypothetical protein